MELKLGENVKNARIRKGWTQEELAILVGISSQGVSKWERGSSYPDIAILPVIARVLDLTIDELLGFKLELDEKQIETIAKEAVDNYGEKGFEKGYAYVEEVLKKYPNSISLKYHLGNLFQYYLLEEGQLEKEKIIKYYNRAIEIYEEVLKSGIGKYENNAKIILVGMYSMVGKLAEAEEMVSTLPDDNLDKDMLYGSIYALQGKAAKAKLLNQKIAKKNAYKLLQAIIILGSQEYEKDINKSYEIIEKGVRIAEELDTYQVSIYPHFIKLLMEMGKIPDAVDYFVKLTDHIINYDGKFVENPIFDKLDESMGLEMNREILIKSVLLDKDFDQLRTEDKVKLAEEKLKKLL